MKYLKLLQENITMNQLNIPLRKPRSLKLGQHYQVSWYTTAKQREVIFMQPTEKGYNFYDILTFKCLLKHHLYPDKKNNSKVAGEQIFWINEHFLITGQ